MTFFKLFYTTDTQNTRLAHRTPLENKNINIRKKITGKTRKKHTPAGGQRKTTRKKTLSKPARTSKDARTRRVCPHLTLPRKTPRKKGRTYFKIQGTYFKIPPLYFSFAPTCAETPFNTTITRNTQKPQKHNRLLTINSCRKIIKTTGWFTRRAAYIYNMSLPNQREYVPFPQMRHGFSGIQDSSVAIAGSGVRYAAKYEIQNSYDLDFLRSFWRCKIYSLK